jgi:hypothetical protein
MPTLDSLLIDTGSSNTWVGAGKPYVKTKSSMNTSNDLVSPPPPPSGVHVELLSLKISR